jgi:hypothetical protein
MKTKSNRSHKKLGWASNAGAASAITGLSTEAIKQARKAGCPACKTSGRIQCDELIEWLAAHPECLEQAGEAVNLQVEKALLTRAERKLREHKLAVANAEYVSVACAEQIGSRLGANIKQVVSTLHLCAPNVVGVSVAEAEARLKEVEDDIMRQLHGLSEAFEDYVGKCPHCGKTIEYDTGKWFLG